MAVSDGRIILPATAWWPADSSDADNMPALFDFVVGDDATASVPHTRMARWNFENAAGPQFIHTAFRLPDNFDARETAELNVQFYGMTSDPGHDVRWMCYVIASSAGLDDVESQPLDTVNVEVETGIQQWLLDEATITLTNDDSAAAYDYLCLILGRNAAHADDDYAGDVFFTGADFSYIRL